MSDEVSPAPAAPLLQIIQSRPDGITYDEIRTQLQPRRKDRALHYDLSNLVRDLVIEPFPDPADGRKVRYRIRVVPAAPAANGQGSPASPAATVQGSAKPPESDRGGNAGETAGDTQPVAAEPIDGSDSGALQAQAFADLHARAVREVVRDVILHLVPPQGVAGMAQTQAAVLHWNGAETAALMADVQVELSCVTPENAAEYGLVPAQVLAWRAASAGADANLKSPGTGSGDRPDRHPNETQRETRKAERGTRSSSAGRTSRGPANENRDSNIATATPPTSTIEDLGNPQSALRTSQFSKALTAFANRLIDRYAPGLAPELRQVLLWAVGALAALLVALCLRYPWVMAIFAAVVIIAVLVIVLVGRTRALGARPPPAAMNGSDLAAVRDRTSPVAATVSEWRSSELTPAIKRRSRPWRGVAAAALAFVLIAGTVAAVWYWRTPSRPSEGAIADYLARSAAPLPVRVMTVTPSYTAVNTTSCSFTYQAVLETTVPLYRRLDATAYLRGRLPPPISELKFQISDVGPAPTPAPKDVVLVTTQTPPGTTAMATGMIVAWRRDSAWTFTPQQGGFDRSRFAGEPKPDGAFAIDDPADVARLNAWLADQVAYAARVQTAAAAAAAERERHRQQQTTAFAQLLRVGTLFVGELTDPVRGRSQRVVLEITAGSTSAQQLSVALRNDGGWTDARPFTGTWTINAADDAAVLTLKSSGRDYVDSAGPLLQDRIDLTFILQMSADGSMGMPSGSENSALRTAQSAIRAALRRVDPAEATAVKEEILRPLAPAFAATAAGLVYRGTATLRTRGTTEPLRLRFAEQQPDGALIRATLESTTVAGAVRPLRGTIVSNTYRVGNSPIQLLTANGDAVARAGSNSVLALQTGNDLRIALRVESGRITGEDPYFTYAFAPEAGANADQGPETRDQRPDGNANGGRRTAESSNTPPSPAPIENRDSKIENPLPPFPAVSGAYVLSGGQWLALPRNNGNIVTSAVEAANGFFGKLNRWEDELAGKTPTKSADIIGDLIFSGREEAPPAPAAALVIAYVGPLALNPKFVAEYPMVQLEDVYALMELAPLKPMNNGNRYTPMSAVFGDLNDLGPRRLPATIEHPAPNVTLLRCTVVLPAGHYALACLKQYFEVIVK